MRRFQILCVTMNQKDFSKVQEMNIHSDIIFANQADRVSYDEYTFENHLAKMITTNTRGVGVNRNIALIYADAEICLFADDDLVYYPNVEDIVLKEFENHPDADVFIFHLESNDPYHKQIQYKRTSRCSRFSRTPWGCVRVAVRLNSVRKSNLWFNTLFGGGCVFPCGEDSMWITSAKRAGLIFYVSKETIGTVSFEQSSWFTGWNKEYYYGQGASIVAEYRRTALFWMLYTIFRTRNLGKMDMKEKMHWLRNGARGYRMMQSYDDFVRIQ